MKEPNSKQINISGKVEFETPLKFSEEHSLLKEITSDKNIGIENYILRFLPKLSFKYDTDKHSYIASEIEPENTKAMKEVLLVAANVMKEYL